MSGWPNVVGVFHKSCPKQRASYLLESTSDGTKTGPRFGCDFGLTFGLVWYTLPVLRKPTRVHLETLSRTLVQ